MKEINIDSAFPRMVLEGASKQGLACDPILLRNGISRLSIEKPGSLVRLNSFAAFAIEVMRELDDEFLGLTTNKQRLGTFNMMCRSCISARTIERSIKRSANFLSLFNNTFEHKIEENDDTIAYILSPLEGEQSINNYLVGAILSSIHRFHCWLGGQFIPLNLVTLNHPEPDYSYQYKDLFYGAPISYNNTECRIEFDKRHAKMEIVQTPETLDQYLAGTNLSLLYQPKNYRAISDQVRQWLERNIKQGNYQATLKEAALHFEMSQQVLHRRLQAADLSFKDIKMQTRRDIAINLLFDKKYKIEEIATMVGFSEPSAFIRAFKSWTGSTPLTYRNQKH